MEETIEIVQCEELLDCVKRALPKRSLEEIRPNYVPPVVLKSGASKWVSDVISLLAEVTSTSSQHRLSVYFYDGRYRNECRVAVTLETQIPPGKRPPTVDHRWADQMGHAYHELLAHSVELKYFYDRGSLFCTFECPVFGGNANSLQQHRDCILLVEDDAFVRNATREILEAEGYRVVTADCAESALDQFKKSCGEVGLIITDLNMPGQDGRALVSAVRREDRRLPVLFISGFSAIIAEDPAALTYFLPKPFSARTLMMAVKRCFSGYHEMNLRTIERRSGASIGWQ